MTGGRLRSAILACSAAAYVVAAAGCAEVGYVAQSVNGHLALLRQARPIDEWLADPATPQALRERLRLAQRLRVFAVRELHLPDNASYTRYADLHRSAAVWNVVAAPELSLALKSWCYPLFGCAGYRGYFDRSAADALAADLRAQGWDVRVYGVPAYSTLGWTEWLGGDPLLNTFVLGSEAELAGLVFHELAHQVVYLRGDTAFNESFASAVERVGVRRWRAATGGAAEDRAAAERRREFRALTTAARDELAIVYASDLADDAKRARKAEVLARLRSAHAGLKAGAWDGDRSYDNWFAGANNASLALLAAYDELVPAFERRLAAVDGDLMRFYAEVRRLAELPRAERRAALDAP